MVLADPGQPSWTRSQRSRVRRRYNRPSERPATYAEYGPDEAETTTTSGCAGHRREPRVSVSRSIFPLVDDRDRAYFGRDTRDQDHVGYIDVNTRAIFGRSYAAEPEVLVKELAGDEAIKAADTLLLTIPNQLGVDYNANVLESILTYVAPELGWR